MDYGHILGLRLFINSAKYVRDCLQPKQRFLYRGVGGVVPQARSRCVCIRGELLGSYHIHDTFIFENHS